MVTFENQNINLTRLLDDIKNDRIVVTEPRDIGDDEIKVANLFDSLLNNYPIGTIILHKKKDKLYVVDGYQRLVHLFRSLSREVKDNFIKYNANNVYIALYFDLWYRSFYYHPMTILPVHCIPVHILLKTSDFRNYFKKYVMSEVVDIETYNSYFDIADKFSRQLYEYKVPVTLISNATDDDIEIIRHRIHLK